MILGANSGVFVSGVAENVVKFASAIPEQSLIGIAIVLALVFLIARRVRWNAIRSDGLEATSARHCPGADPAIACSAVAPARRTQVLGTQLAS